MILLFLLMLNCFALEQKIYPEENRKNIKPLSIGRKIDWDYGLYRSLYQSNDGNIVLKKWDRAITCPNNLIYRFLCRWLTKSNGSICAKTSMYVFESLQPSSIKQKIYNALFAQSKYSHAFDSFLLIQNQKDKISITKIIRKPDCGKYYHESLLFYPLIDEHGTVQFLAEQPERSGKQPAFPLYEWRVYSTNKDINLYANDYYISGKFLHLFYNAPSDLKLYYSDYEFFKGRTLLVYFEYKNKSKLHLIPFFHDYNGYTISSIRYENFIRLLISKTTPIVVSEYIARPRKGGGFDRAERVIDLKQPDIY